MIICRLILRLQLPDPDASSLPDDVGKPIQIPAIDASRRKRNRYRPKGSSKRICVDTVEAAMERQAGTQVLPANEEIHPSEAKVLLDLLEETYPELWGVIDTHSVDMAFRLGTARSFSEVPYELPQLLSWALRFQPDTRAHKHNRCNIAQALVLTPNSTHYTTGNSSHRITIQGMINGNSPSPISIPYHENMAGCWLYTSWGERRSTCYPEK